MNDLEQSIRAGFDSFQADELRHLNAVIQRKRDELDHLLRRKAELLGRIEEVFTESPVEEQPGIDRLMGKVAA